MSSKLSAAGLTACMACMAVLAACGGGGSGGGNNTPTAPDYGISFSASSVLVERDVQDRSDPTARTVALTLARPPAGNYWYDITYTERMVSFVSASNRADGGLDFRITFAYPGQAAAGTYDDRVEVRICADRPCTQPVAGSPFVLPVRVVIGYLAASDPLVGPLTQADVQTLDHDFVAAAYSRQLDALVVLSSRPTPALVVHELARGQSRRTTLLTTGTSLSLSPDGARAAVGHDAAITTVELIPDQQGSMRVQRYPVGARVGALLLDGTRRVHFFDNQVQTFNRKSTLDLDTGQTSDAGNRSVFGIPFLAPHPGASRFYYADSINPGDIIVAAYGVGFEPFQPVDSPYHGDYSICGRVWLSPAGSRLYTAGGATFTASSDPAADMRYAGTLPLTGSPAAGGACTSGDQHQAISLSASADGNRVALLEQPFWKCHPTALNPTQCFTRFALHDASTLSRLQHRSLGPLTNSLGRFAQDGRLLFHRSNGDLLLLSQLRNLPDATTSLRLSRVPLTP